MPLIVICGGPCSGKTTRAMQLKQYYESKNQVVTLINEEQFNINKSSIYASSTSEKTHRSLLKSLLEKHISPKTLTIIDSLNYIKGSRYEFYCLVRNCKTRHCVIYLKTPLSSCIANNAINKEYDDDLLKDLYSRMEEPIQSNRWDCPMYTVYPDDTLPYEDIDVSLFEGKKPKEPISTKMDIAFDGDYMAMLDRSCQEVIADILKQQEEGVGCVVDVKGKKVEIGKMLSVVQLKKIKAEFIRISKNVPPRNKEEAVGGFVEYIVTILDRY
jgi:protein KTI12